MLKQVILVRTDLKMPKGKMATQCSHAAVEAVLNSDSRKIEAWRLNGMKKSVLKVNDKKELFECNKKAKALGLKTALITDAGKTFFKKSTTTCLAIGPDEEYKIDKVTGNLKLI